MKDVISVIVVTYNRLDYLKLTIESILSQSYRALEVIVVGDGHQPDVDGYVNQHQDLRISYFHVDHCGYPAKGRNLGIQNSRGSLIAFCDDDDIWASDKLAKQLDVFRKQEDISLCCTNRSFINCDGKILMGKSLKWLPTRYTLNRLLLSNFVSYSSVLLKREILVKAGLFPDDIKFKAIEDYHLWIRIAYFGRISFLNEKLVLYRIHNSNITSKLSLGANRNIQLYRDLFNRYKFKKIDQLMAYSAAYFKLFYYKLIGR